MSRRLSRGEREPLDFAVRNAVADDRERLCRGLRQVRKVHDAYPLYSGGYLSLGNLAYLVAQKMASWSTLTEWTETVLYNALRSDRRDKVLPDELRERQLLLEAVDSAMRDCFRKAKGVGRSVRDPHDYLSYLGAEPVSLSFAEIDFDPRSIGFFPITQWNANRRLDEDLNVGIVQEVLHKPEQDWVDPALLQRYLHEAHSKPGSLCPTLVGYEEDTRESQGQELILKVAQSRYYRNVAIGKCLRENPEIYEQAVRRVRTLVPGTSGLENLLTHVPDSNISLNVTVSSRTGEVMLIKRPDDAPTWGGYYQAGPHETMNSPMPGTRYHENCFELARRALWEEVRIEPNDLAGAIVFSWFGYYIPEAQGYFFAHAQTFLSRNEIIQKARLAESAFEIDRIEWLDPATSTIEHILATWSSGPWSAGQDDRGRTFLPHAALSLTQLNRVLSQGMMPRVRG